MEALNERHRSEAEKFANSLWKYEGDEYDFDSPAGYSSMSVTDDSLPDLKVRRGRTKPAKASRGEAVYKIRIHGRRRVLTDVSVMAALCRTGTKPNVSRRPPSNILYAFPTFDKCDSLLYLPSTMSKHLNTGDMVALTKLFNAHLDKNCDFSMSGCFSNVTSVQQLVKVYQLMDDLQPDRIMCVHTTKVVENQILASIYLKFTDCKAIYDSYAKSIQHRKYGHIHTGNRMEDLHRRLFDEMNLSEELKKEYSALTETADDFVIYMTLSMVFTFDDVTKKVTRWNCNPAISSMHATETATKDLCDV